MTPTSRVPHLRGTVAAAALVLAAVAPPSALAAGGQSIASATPVVYGQQQFGNTFDSPPVNGCGSKPAKRRSWWALSVTAGDALTIDWESQVTPLLGLFPVGTTDYTFTSVDPTVKDYLDSSTHKSEAKVDVGQTGTMPLEFVTDPDCIDSQSPAGPYDFVATVRHAVRLSLPAIHSVQHSGTLAVAARNPDGQPLSDPSLHVTVQRRTRAGWASAGTATVANGVATVRLHVPTGWRGARVQLRAASTGADYRDAYSRSISVRVR